MAGIKERPFWKDTAPQIPSYADRPLPDEADVVVIGGGYTGVSTALHLAKKGAHVILLERETLGWGASSRNGGMVLSGLKIPVQLAIRRYGLETARRLYQAALDSIDCVEQLVRDDGIECDFRRSGAIGMAYKLSHFHRLRQTQALLARDFRHQTELVSRDEQRSEIGSDFYHGGLVDPRGAGLHPGKYIAGLVCAAGRAGVDLHDHVQALEIKPITVNDPRSTGGSVITSNGTIRARQVMLATNGYSGPVHKALRRRMIPIGSYIVVTEPLPDELACEVSPRGRMIWDSKNFLYYFRLTPDNRMLFGGRASFVPSTPETNQVSARILRRAMTTVYPQLAGVRVEYVWGGTLGFTLDRLPHAGEMGGVHFAMGYCGHGVAMATYLGKCMAEVIDGNPEANPFRELPFPPVPLYTGLPWFLPLAGAYYKVLDWLS